MSDVLLSEGRTLSATTGLIVGERNNLFDFEWVSGVVVLLQGVPTPGMLKSPATTSVTAGMLVFVGDNLDLKDSI